MAMPVLALEGCGSSGPPPTVYVLGGSDPEVPGVEPLTGRAVVEVKPVLVPDYLDVTDLLVRRAGNVVAPSQTGRWGERLSVGATRALAGTLAQRLPGVVIVTAPPAERPARQVLVDLEVFEAQEETDVILIGRWRLLDGAGRETLAGERVSLKEPVAGASDTKIVAAMSRALALFAQRVAIGVKSRLSVSG
ncbi:PqiC family protein [Pseudoroseomonas sp. WGS1072]|uniref:PqiC family protein n=1 Tax=Roseomonas sp. WGS1072 TaxID=3366816 RepID=UPI003BEF8B27